MLYSRHVIGLFKEPECNCAEHRNYNYQLARLLVKSENANGILKELWGSLKELSLSLGTEHQFSFAMTWITACVVLHSVCIEEGDIFPTPQPPEPSPASSVEPVVGGR